MTMRLHLLQHVLPSFVFAALVGSMSSATMAAPPTLSGNNLLLDFGSNDGPHAVVTINKNRAATAALKIETFRAGVAGSKISIMIDNDAAPMFTHIFTKDECKIEGDRNYCATTVVGRVPEYGRLLNGFRKGSVSRLELQTDGTMNMSHVSTLAGFDRAYMDDGR